MKRDKARTITQERVQDLINIELNDMLWFFTRGLKRCPPHVSHPRDRYDAHKLHHYDPAPVQRATAPKRRRWRI